MPRPARTIAAYLAGIIAGGTLAILASHYAFRDNVYVMLAVLLVVGAALLGGTGPAVALAVVVVAHPVAPEVIVRHPPQTGQEMPEEPLVQTTAVVKGVRNQLPAVGQHLRRRRQRRRRL